jgi:hypothetical protein
MAAGILAASLATRKLADAIGDRSARPTFGIGSASNRPPDRINTPLRGVAPDGQSFEPLQRFCRRSKNR